MNAQRLSNPDAALSQRQPRIKNPKHLMWIRTLPCILSGHTQNIHAVHIRFGDLNYNKPNAGLGSKPSDCWVLPLRSNLHVGHIYSQHSHGEREWWTRFNVDPLRAASELYKVSGNTEAALEILQQYRRI